MFHESSTLFEIQMNTLHSTCFWNTSYFYDFIFSTHHFSFTFSARIKKVRRHRRTLCVSCKATWNYHLSRWIGHSKFWIDLWTAASGEAFSCSKIRPPSFQIQTDTTRPFWYCGVEAAKACGIQVNDWNCFNEISLIPNRWFSELTFCQFVCPQSPSKSWENRDTSRAGEK